MLQYCIRLKRLIYQKYNNLWLHRHAQISTVYRQLAYCFKLVLNATSVLIIKLNYFHWFCEHVMWFVDKYLLLSLSLFLHSVLLYLWHCHLELTYFLWAHHDQVRCVMCVQCTQMNNGACNAYVECAVHVYDYNSSNNEQNLGLMTIICLNL